MPGSGPLPLHTPPRMTSFGTSVRRQFGQVITGSASVSVASLADKPHQAPRIASLESKPKPRTAASIGAGPEPGELLAKSSALRTLSSQPSDLSLASPSWPVGAWPGPQLVELRTPGAGAAPDSELRPGRSGAENGVLGGTSPGTALDRSHPARPDLASQAVKTTLPRHDRCAGSGWPTRVLPVHGGPVWRRPRPPRTA